MAETRVRRCVRKLLSKKKTKNRYGVGGIVAICQSDNRKGKYSTRKLIRRTKLMVRKSASKKRASKKNKKTSMSPRKSTLRFKGRRLGRRNTVEEPPMSEVAATVEPEERTEEEITNETSEPAENADNETQELPVTEEPEEPAKEQSNIENTNTEEE